MWESLWLGNNIRTINSFQHFEWERLMLVVAEDQRAREMVCILYILIFHLLLALASLWPPLTWKVQPKKMALILLAQYFSKSFKKILVGCWKQFYLFRITFCSTLTFCISYYTLWYDAPLFCGYRFTGVT